MFEQRNKHLYTENYDTGKARQLACFFFFFSKPLVEGHKFKRGMKHQMTPPKNAGV